MKALLISTVCIATAWAYLSMEPAVVLGPGVLVTTAPHQSNISGIKPFEFKGYTITPLANINFSAKILSKKNYFSDKEAKLSPVDLALGWQNMSDQAVIDQLSISQSSRRARWETIGGYPIPRREIETQSTNMHMIPANSLVERILKKTKKGQIISIDGYLIRADAQNWHWKSSLTRKDTGGGACEVVYVNSIDILKK